MEFTTFATSPTWVETPTDQIAYLGESFYYDLNATDESGISSWWINDTTNFDINILGQITDKISLDLGKYWIEVRAYDPYGRFCDAIFTVTVEEPTISEYSIGFSFILPSLTTTLVILAFIRKKKYKKRA